MSEKILLVTPVWNDSKRLAVYGRTLAPAFAAAGLPVRWIIADDGSGPEEAERLAALQREFAAVYPAVEVHLAAAHRGKGSVIREAWALDRDAAWLAFVDADGSVDANELIRLLGEASRSGQSVIGIRKRTATTRISESLWRSIFHHGYLLVVHLLLGLRSEDLQCGAKVLRASDYQKVEALLEEEGFAFDTELLGLLNHHGVSWREIPVNWFEKKGGKVRPLRDAWRMWLAVLRIRKRMRKN